MFVLFGPKGPKLLCTLVIGSNLGRLSVGAAPARPLSAWVRPSLVQLVP